jgi:hypothetical protein
MASYYVNNNAQSTGEHEVHKAGCSFMPSDRKYLGEYDSCRPAVIKAKEYYSNVDGCYYCCPACHNR